MFYVVYCATFTTLLGTVREYIGCTRALDLRRWWHERKPPAWMKPRGGELKLTVLERDLPTKEAALASEAIHAARAISRRPHQARGGPYVKPTLPLGALEEVNAVASVRSFVRLSQIAADNVGGLLWKHLKDVRFVEDAAAPMGATVAKKRKSGQSGSTGYKSRTSQVQRHILKIGSKEHKILHRGIDVGARRKAESDKRPKRTGQCREPAKMQQRLKKQRTKKQCYHNLVNRPTVFFPQNGGPQKSALPPDV